MGGGDHVSEVLEEVEGVGELAFGEVFALLQLRGNLPVVWHLRRHHLLLQLSLLLRHLEHLDHHNRHGEDQAQQPKEGGALARFFLVDAFEELDLSEDLQVIEDPIEKESQSTQDVEYLLVLGALLSGELLDFLVLDDGLGQTEELTGVSHALYTTTNVYLVTLMALVR